MTAKMIEHKSLYSTAEDLLYGGVFKVKAQDAECKDDVEHLLLEKPEGDEWVSIGETRPCF